MFESDPNDFDILHAGADGRGNDGYKVLTNVLRNYFRFGNQSSLSADFLILRHVQLQTTKINDVVSSSLTKIKNFLMHSHSFEDIGL